MSLVAALAPHDGTTAAAMLADAAATRTALFPEGNRTKMLGADTGRARPLSTRLLTQGLAHYAGDLVATVPAGVTLRDANDVLAREGQWIPLDPRWPAAATIGGIVATNDSGPRRHRFGTPRDLVIGIEVALANGQVARSGGRVVKNVAGYDLGRLFCGSRGSLGIVTTVTFKLAPRSQASRTVVARYERREPAAAAATAIATSPALTPSAIELAYVDGPCRAWSSDGRGIHLLVRFESTPRSAAHMASAAQALLANEAGEVTTVEGDAEAGVWAEHGAIESSHEGLLTSISVLPTQIVPALHDIELLASRFDLGWSLAGRAGLGVLRVRTSGASDAQLQFAVALRTAILRLSGHVTFLSGPDDVVHSAGPFGPAGSAAAAAVAVKQRFDPAGILPFPWAVA
jgi:glycolate oxidase FAD binding subunit